MQGHSGANLVPVIASNRCLYLFFGHLSHVLNTAVCSERKVQSAGVLHTLPRSLMPMLSHGRFGKPCMDRCGTESFPERPEKTASSVKFHGGSFITGYTGDIVQQV